MTPSLNIDPRTYVRARRVLATLIVGNALLVGHLAGGVSLGIVLVFLAAAVALAVRSGGAKERTTGTIETSLEMTAVGGLGMLLGLALDAGPFGMLGLIALCNANHAAAPGLDAVLRHVHYMPAASIGMMAGCILMTPARCFTRTGARPLPAARCCRHLLIILGMLWGMVWAESLSQSFFTTSSASFLVAGALTSMLAGMFVGTLLTASLTSSVAGITLWFTGRRVQRESLRSP